MSIRSPGLLALSVALMAASGALAYVLDHDAVGQAAALDAVAAGEDVTLRGTLEPYLPRVASSQEAARWAPVTREFDNFTYVLATGATEEVVLVTSPTQGPVGTVVVTTGPVLLRAPHPDGSGRTLVVVHATDLAQPLVFR